ncbi:hypothetical protein GMRT_13141 [Giardia muris]|uniref:Uncharacterized protein n=1 Tax=Giardia muris TaxID=5742 RepID=A0A4Z1T2L5_GIAMU|nr:hypothetical protein GMRT_13141 [Giardia muris]|eukprot:TNJ26661.1 hypothetical protein GMRT_13141 [Giardia muris]
MDIKASPEALVEELRETREKLNWYKRRYAELAAERPRSRPVVEPVDSADDDEEELDGASDLDNSELESMLVELFERGVELGKKRAVMQFEEMEMRKGLEMGAPVSTCTASTQTAEFTTSLLPSVQLPRPNDVLEVAYDTISVLLNALSALRPSPQQVQRIVAGFRRRGIVPLFLNSAKTSFSLPLGSPTRVIVPRLLEGAFIPDKAYYLMSELAARYAIEPAVAGEFLLGLCALIRELEQEAGRQREASLRQQIDDLQRRHSMQMPYDRVRANDQIRALKIDLQHFKSLYLRSLGRQKKQVRVLVDSSSPLEFRSALARSSEQILGGLQRLEQSLVTQRPLLQEAREEQARLALSADASVMTVAAHNDSQPPFSDFQDGETVEVTRTLLQEFEQFAEHVRKLFERALSQTSDPSLLRRLYSRVDDLLTSWSRNSRQVLLALLAD